jgi:hypothetical protein
MKQIRQIVIAQIIDRFPDGTVSVRLDDGTYLSEIRVRVGRRRSNPTAIHAELPERMGSFGLYPRRLPFWCVAMRPG